MLQDESALLQSTLISQSFRKQKQPKLYEKNHYIEFEYIYKSVGNLSTVGSSKIVITSLIFKLWKHVRFV